MTLPIIELLDLRGLAYKLRGDEVAIVCPNGANHQGGRDSIESFSINLEGRGGHCFACGFSLKPDSLIRWLAGEDIEELDREVLACRAKLTGLTASLDETIYEEPREVFFPYGEPWDEDGHRGISIDTYQRLGAVRVHRGVYENRIAFPVSLHGELIGVDARTLGDALPKYRRNKNSSCKENWLYPYDIVKQMIHSEGWTYAIIGEGLFHAVNAIDKGFPGLCFFGGHNFTSPKISLLLGLGIDEIIYFPDKDKAGFEACKNICQMLEPWFEVSVADVSELALDVEATAKKGKEVYPDLGDLSAGTIHKCILNRKCFNEADLPK